MSFIISINVPILWGERGILAMAQHFLITISRGEKNGRKCENFNTLSYAWILLTNLCNIRIGQAVFLRKKAYTPTRIISERIHHGNIWVSACQESGLNRLTHYTNCVFHSIVFIVCSNYRDITKIRCPQLFQLGNSTYWFFIWIWFQFRNVSSGCNFSSF